MGKNFMLALKIKKLIIWGALGHSLMVELRTLTPSVLVRIQLPQPGFLPELKFFSFLVIFYIFFTYGF